MKSKNNPINKRWQTNRLKSLLISHISIITLLNCSKGQESKNLYPIFVRGIDSKTHVINYDQGEPFEKIKDKIRDQTGISNKDQFLTIDGKSLINTTYLSPYTSLNLSCKLKGGSGPHFMFVDFSKKNTTIKKFSKAPKWRRIGPGLNLEGRCENEKCEANGKYVWCLISKEYKQSIMKGNGVDKNQEIIDGAHFNDFLSISCYCPICKDPINKETIKWMGFYKCYFDIIGTENGTRRKIINIDNKTSSSEGFIYFNGSKMLDLCSLIISARPLDYKEKKEAEERKKREEEAQRIRDCEARKVAEQRAEREAQARKAETERAEREAQARKAETERAEREAQARKAAEQKAQAAEQKLAQLMKLLNAKQNNEPPVTESNDGDNSDADNLSDGGYEMIN